MTVEGKVIRPDYDFYFDLPDPEDLFNPLTDCPTELREDSELTEFYKLCNEFFSPELAVKYLLNLSLYPYQMSALRAMLMHQFPMLLFTRGGSKTFSLAVYSIIHAILFPNSKIILISASFRQSKNIFNFIKTVYDRSPLLQQISDRPPTISTDRCQYYINGSSIIALPLGQGDKIRGERANVILADEFDSIPIEIFDVVIRGFAAVSMDPWHKTKEILISRKKSKEEIKEVEDDYRDQLIGSLISSGNKIVLSGTAGYKNGTFYRMYKHYRTIIMNRLKGSARDYSDMLGSEFSEEQSLDYRDYCIVTYPHERLLNLAPGMMEEKVLADAKANMPKALFDMEYNCVFADDTLGFFKQKDIVAATSKYPDGWGPVLRGVGNKAYVMGVDPARNTDRFAITIVELSDPTKVVYCWTCQGEKYSFGAKKIRELRRLFNIVAIGLDTGGGGYAVEELLNTAEVMKDGDSKIYRVDGEDEGGEKTLHMIDFTSNWIDQANTSLQKNIEDKRLMFPMAINMGKDMSKEEIVDEINELKRELVSVEMTFTKTGKRHFDLMPVTSASAEDVARHKDRYSSLLIANWLAATMSNPQIDKKARSKKIYEQTHGGYIEDFN